MSQISNPNRIELCEICNNPLILEPRDVGFKMWYIATYKGHEGCVIEKQRVADEISREREAEETRRRDECRREKVAKSICDGFRDSGISPDRRRFEDLKKYTSNAKAFDLAVKWTFPESGFCLFGPPGTGKSHVLAAIAQTIPDRFDASFSIIRWGRWVKEHYAENDFAAREARSRHIREVGVLFIDDIGAEKLSEHAESLLDDAIHEREEFRRPTFMSSNLTPEGLESILTPRLWSRMQSLMEFVQVGGKDVRKTKGVKK